MKEKQSFFLNITEQFVLISFFYFFIPLVLFIFRRLDNNSLTSWRWIFADLGGGGLFLVLLVGCVLALTLTRLSFYERKPVFLFFAAWISGALFWGEPEVIVDASRYFTQAKSLELYGPGYFMSQWGEGVFAWTDLPLMPFIYGLVFKYLGEARIYIQLLNTTLFGLTAVLTCLIGKTFWDDEVGFWAGLLLLGMPYLLTQVGLMLVDIPTMFFLTLSVYTFAMALKRGGGFLILLAAGALFLAFFVKYSNWLFLSVNVFVLLIYIREHPGAAVRRGAAVLLCFALLAGMIIGPKYQFFIEQITLIKEYQKPGLSRWSESFASTFLFHIHPFITLAALFSFYRAIRKKDLRYPVICFLVLLLVVLQIKRIRYILPVLPMLALLASYGLCSIRERVVRKYIVLSAVSCSLAMGLAAYLPFLQGMSVTNLKDAGEFLEKQDSIETALVVVSPAGGQILNPVMSVPLLDLYTGKNILFADRDFSVEKPVDYQTSSLRFTWEYRLPPYYRAGAVPGEGADAVVLVGQNRNPILSVKILEMIKGYTKRKTFARTSGVFKHQTFVTVYH